MNFSDIKSLPGYDDQKLVVCVHDKKTGLDGFISIHRGNLQRPAFGATRIWNYEDPREALIDALRLSKLMSYKASMAGLACGGAKAAIIFPKVVDGKRKELLRAYAQRVNYLGGHFITGADVGVTGEDVKFMRKHSPYFVGTKVDPVRFTGLGILYSIEVCLSEVFGNTSLKSRSFAIQGVGKVGQEVLKLIYGSAGDIYIYDIDASQLKATKSRFPRVKVVGREEIGSLKVDVFSPNALSDCLTDASIKKLRSRIVVGGANCQLQNDDIGLKLHRKGILYAPDYVVNAGGLISVYDEYEYHNSKIKRVLKRLAIVKKNMQAILAKSKKVNKPPVEIANQMAEKIFNTMS
ncbi:MAG: Leucine dehydrogenase [uncultured bacterium]|nr:MAG: Leucine dehydrogenase [uncultured bacterium]